MGLLRTLLESVQWHLVPEKCVLRTALVDRHLYRAKAGRGGTCFKEHTEGWVFPKDRTLNIRAALAELGELKVKKALQKIK